jgi:predicted aldo/keto reductase-like oxidoreductase
METVRLGKTGLEVSRVGMGGIPLTRPSEEDAIKVVQRALDLGINFFDTAIGYGISEERIGKALAAMAGRRDRVILATKGGTVQHIEWSLQRLRTDYIDLWQFHGINSFERLGEVLQPGGALEEVQQARRASKIRHIGFSSHSLRVALEAVASGRFETVQFPLNFISAEAVEELVPLARAHDVGFIAMKPFAGGRIRDANLALKYLLRFDNVVPDPGIERVEEIEEIVGIVNSGQWKLTPQEWQAIEAIRARVGTRFCRQCEYCMPCPQGVHIPGVMYLPILWELWPPDWFLSWAYVKNAVESAQGCLQCGECEEKCPYQLPIREMIVENIAFYERVAAEHHSLSGPAGH